jgi:hypothetical protein
MQSYVHHRRLMPMGLLEYAHYALQVCIQTNRDPQCLCYAVGIMGRAILFAPVPDREKFCETKNVMDLLVSAALMGRTGAAPVFCTVCAVEVFRLLNIVSAASACVFCVIMLAATFLLDQSLHEHPIPINHYYA